jgi:drug/metabolite transporter (DMT)-like permease
LPPLLRLGVITFFGAIWHLPYIAYEVFLQHDIVTLIPKIFGIAFILVFVASLGAFVSFGVVVSELGATRAGTILFLSTVYNAVLAVTLLGEMLAQYHFVSLALVLLGLWLAKR